MIEVAEPVALVSLCSLAVEHSLSKREVVGSNPAIGFFFVVVGKLVALIDVYSVLLGGRQCVREVKELDLKSNGLCPHGFEPRRCRLVCRSSR